MGYVGQNMCQIHLWCIWHRCPSIAHLVPQSGSPTLLRCQIKRFWHRSRDVRELAPLCTQTHMYKQINQTNYTSLSLSQTSVFLLPQSSLSLPRSGFFIAWVNLAPEQSRWSRLGHQVSNGGASMPNASQVNLAHVLAYIAHFCTPSVPKFLS